MNEVSRLVWVLVPMLVGVLALDARAAAGETRIATWKYDRQAAFLLMFDDSEPTHLSNAIPELEKRELIGTFYLNPGAKWYDAKGWEKVAANTRMVLANHSMHHSGATSNAVAEAELGDCQEVLHQLYPGRKSPRLISLSYPGGSPWTISEADKAAMLKKFHLVVRPPANGRPPLNGQPPEGGHVGGVHLKTGAEMAAVVDRALANRNMDYVTFHGIGGDWLKVSMEDYIQLLDAVAAKRDQLWVTDPVSVHKYETERNQATVQVLENGPATIRLALRALNDPLYDEPLTLITPVPAAWKTCSVTQGDRRATVAVEQGAIRYEALPDGPEIVVQSVP